MCADKKPVAEIGPALFELSLQQQNLRAIMTGGGVVRRPCRQLSRNTFSNRSKELSTPEFSASIAEGSARDSIRATPVSGPRVVPHARL